jgi:Plexin repeat
VYYVGTNMGRIYKIVQFMRNGESKSKLLDIFEIAPNEAIQVMEISKTKKSLYVATDHRVKQIDLVMCNRRYDNCYRCVKDPYCGWDKETNTCKPYELSLLQVRVFFLLFTHTYVRVRIYNLIVTMTITMNVRE